MNFYMVYDFTKYRVSIDTILSKAIADCYRNVLNAFINVVDFYYWSRPVHVLEIYSIFKYINFRLHQFHSSYLHNRT